MQRQPLPLMPVGAAGPGVSFAAGPTERPSTLSTADTRGVAYVVAPSPAPEPGPQPDGQADGAREAPPEPASTGGAGGHAGEARAAPAGGEEAEAVGPRSAEAGVAPAAELVRASEAAGPRAGEGGGADLLFASGGPAPDVESLFLDGQSAPAEATRLDLGTRDLLE
jgi:hypothetical protein